MFNWKNRINALQPHSKMAPTIHAGRRECWKQKIICFTLNCRSFAYIFSPPMTYLPSFLHNTQTMAKLRMRDIIDLESGGVSFYLGEINSQKIYNLTWFIDRQLCRTTRKVECRINPSQFEYSEWQFIFSQIDVNLEMICCSIKFPLFSNRLFPICNFIL